MQLSELLEMGWDISFKSVDRKTAELKVLKTSTKTYERMTINTKALADSDALAGMLQACYDRIVSSEKAEKERQQAATV